MATKPEKNIETIISSIEKILLYILLSVLPVSILPFPWDLTEKGMTIVILFFTLIIGTLEIFKIIWSGKILFLKRDSDLIIFLLFISFVLTTIFAQDSNLSLFGYDYRLSNGLIGSSSILILTFLSRSFISTKKDLLNLFIAFFIGSILTTFFSLISFFGGNIFSIFPKIGMSDMEGFPTLGSPALIVIYNCVALLLAYISLHMYRNDNEQIDASWFSVVTILVNLFSIIVFSMENTIIEKRFTNIVTTENQLASICSLSFLYMCKEIYARRSATQLYITISAGEPKVGKPSISDIPILGKILNIFPPKKDIKLKNVVNILPIKNAINRFKRSFFVDIKLLDKNVNINIEDDPIRPLLNR